MIRFHRPEEPESFHRTVRAARANIDSASAKPRPLADGDFPNLWSRYKTILAAAQYSKCGYCERDITNHAGDVEHYRPKGKLEELPPKRADWGSEDPRTGNIASPRRLLTLCDQGYPWLAYEWSNYLVACNSCNSKWKRCLFPVVETPRPVPPVRGGTETPLLLDPFGEIEPLEHLKFSDVGAVEPRNDSPIGRATIDTCALDRPSLIRSRAQAAADVIALIMDFKEAKTEAAEDRLLERLCEKAAADRPHAGMVRSILSEAMPGLDWSQIESTQ
jgi:hypothetical protein